MSTGPSTASDTHTLLWLGPDEWLLLTDYDKAHQTAVALKASIENYPGAITNVSDNRIQFFYQDLIAT